MHKLNLCILRNSCIPLLMTSFLTDVVFRCVSVLHLLINVCVCVFQRRTSRVISSVTAASHMEEGQGPSASLNLSEKCVKSQWKLLSVINLSDVTICFMLLLKGLALKCASEPDQDNGLSTVRDFSGRDNTNSSLRIYIFLWVHQQ